MLSSELKACLEGYQNDGRLDSVGEFTIDRELAQTKLDEFRLLDPYLYVLNLVACAVHARASRIDFEGDSDDLLFRADTDLGSIEDFQSFENAGLSPTGPALLELAIALTGAAQLESSRAEVCYRRHGQQVTYRLKDSRWKRGDVSTTTAEPVLEVKIREKPSLRTGRKFFARMTGSELVNSESDILSRHCSRCPVPLFFNGSALVRPIQYEKSTRVSIFAPPDAPPPPAHLLTGSHDLVPSFSEHCWGVLGYGGQLPPWLTLVVNGVNFRLPAQPKDELRGFLFARHLKKDLSQAQLVRDGTYQNTLKQARKMGQRSKV